ncbi:HpcH/HpaI aldolase/citrate lyase family protein [Sulfurimonas sp. SAG-AH-194-C20]|nr:HpcH/HpaI aldolase/citrate lyase family protein [Sulfurimonas sp. SAG-AH-194-C20]MDF1878062.1 HpcH/HpaI aldolase/citrate lyase family protein [Sulfurimonas sp. SAG-AH-194-C20]
MKSFNYLHLGATLFIPASHLNLQSIVSGEKYPALKSLVIDFEDGLEEEDFDISMQSMDKILQKIQLDTPLVFIRAKNVQHLSQLLKLRNITKITGFVLAKFSLVNARSYLDLLKETKYLLMPSVEGEELFNHAKLHELKELISACRDKVLLVRFGLEDMLKHLSMRRRCDESIFDFSATSSVLGNFIATFKSAGFSVSGGVYPCFKDTKGFIKDVKRDIKEGLFSKTIIHPNQIQVINELYKVSKEEYEEALDIVSSDKKVFNQNEKMAETLTMYSYSKELIQRVKIYGIKVQ